MNLHPKVKAGLSVGAVATIVVAALSLAGITVPPTVVAAVETLIIFAAGYLAPGVVVD